MSHVFRFLAQRIDSNLWELSKEELQHLEKVLRIKAGSLIELADGAGYVGFATWGNYEKLSSGICITTEREQFFSKSDITLTVCMPALAHKDMDDLVADLSEVGVDRFYIFSGQGSDRSRINDKTVERWQRIAVAAMKQCKRAWTMEIEVFDSLDEVLLGTKGIPIKIWASEVVNENAQRMTSESKNRILLIGGEKGLTEAEQKTAAKYQFVGMSFGPHVMRAKTCAVVAAGMMLPTCKSL